MWIVQTYQALAEGRRISLEAWGDAKFIYLKDGILYSSEVNKTPMDVWDPIYSEIYAEDWIIHE
jgi:hypothetical protein